MEVHGEYHPELLQIYDLFSQSAMDLSMHLQKEERILFPLIRELSDAERSGYPVEQGHCETIQNPISVMRELHEHIHLENNILFPKAIKLEKLFC